MNVIAELGLFTGMVVFGIFIPHPFIFALLGIVLLVAEFNIREQNAVKRHKEMMRMLNLVAKSNKPSSTRKK